MAKHTAKTVREIRRTEIARLFELDNGRLRALIGSGADVTGFEADPTNAEMKAIVDAADDDAFETAVFVAARAARGR